MVETKTKLALYVQVRRIFFEMNQNICHQKVFHNKDEEMQGHNI